jgi:hypothetical protein
MIDIEEQINKRMEKIQKNNFDVKGEITEKKQNGYTVTILNLSDFKTNMHNILYKIIDEVLIKNKVVNVKEYSIRGKGEKLIFEGVMDGTEGNYFINNIIFRITDIKIIRGKKNNDKTFFYTPFDKKIRYRLYQTDEDYIADINEAKTEKKVLLEEEFLEEITGKEKKICYSDEINKIFFN